MQRTDRKNGARWVQRQAKMLLRSFQTPFPSPLLHQWRFMLKCSGFCGSQISKSLSFSSTNIPINASNRTINRTVDYNSSCVPSAPVHSPAHSHFYFHFRLLLQISCLSLKLNNLLVRPLMTCSWHVHVSILRWPPHPLHGCPQLWQKRLLTETVFVDQKDPCPNLCTGSHIHYDIASTNQFKRSSPWNYHQ